MSELKSNLQQILQEKTTKLIPENIKRNVEIFDVTGTDGDAEVAELQAKILETQNEIDLTRRDLENATASVPGTGENIILNGTSEATFKKLDVGGNSTQQIYTGKNLAKVSGSASINLLGSISVSKDSNNIIINGTATGDTASQKAFVLDGDTHGNYAAYITPSNTMSLTAGTYVLTVNNITGSYSGVGAFWIRFVKKNESQPHTAIASLTLPSTSISFSIEEDGEYFISPNFSYTSETSVTFSNYKFNVMLASGSDTSYEPYCGGTASPNPSYPQEIHNVGDNINLIDYTTVQPTSNTTVVLIENGFKASGKYAGMIVVTGLKENTNYFLQYERRNIVGNQTAVNVYAGTTQSTTLKNMLYPSIFNTGNNTTINIWFYTSMGGDLGETDFTNIKLEEGSVMTPYSPYNTGNAQIFINNKNLFAYNSISLNSYYEIINNTRYFVKRINYLGAFCQQTPIPVKAGETIHYYFKNNYSSVVRLYVFIVDKNMKYVADYEWGGSIAVNSIISKSKTLPSNAAYLLFSVLDVADDTDITDIENSFEIQVEYSSTKTDFIKGNMQTFVFPLAEGQKLMLGDYLADDGIHHVRGQKTYKGTEGWWEYSSLALDNTRVFALTNNIAPKNSNCLSNYFNTSMTGWGNLTQIDKEILQIYSDKQVYIRISKDRANNLTDFNTWLSTHNTIVEYELEEEEIIPYTSAQQTVYDTMKKAISYQKQTNISAFLTYASPIFTVIAYRDPDLAITSLENRVTLLED